MFLFRLGNSPIRGETSCRSFHHHRVSHPLLGWGHWAARKRKSLTEPQTYILSEARCDVLTARPRALRLHPCETRGTGLACWISFDASDSCAGRHRIPDVRQQAEQGTPIGRETRDSPVPTRIGSRRRARAQRDCGDDFEGHEVITMGSSRSRQAGQRGLDDAPHMELEFRAQNSNEQDRSYASEAHQHEQARPGRRLLSLP